MSQSEASTVSDFIRTEFVKLNVYNVIDKSDMEKILEEVAFQHTGCTDASCAVQIGKILKVSKMVVGTVSKLNDIYSISANIVDVETGKIEKSSFTNCTSITDLRDSGESLAQGLAGVEISPETESNRMQIIKKTGNEVIINRGYNDFIRERQIFKVISNGKEIVGKILIEKVEDNVSRGLIVDDIKDINAGLPLAYSGKKRVGSFGMLGAVNGLLLRYEYISKFNIGLQIGYGSFFKTKKKYLQTAANSYDIFKYEVDYDNPIFLKYHFCYDDEISPYIGWGLYKNSLFSISGSNFENECDLPSTGIFKPVFAAGLDLLNIHAVHLTFDWEYFIDKKLFDTGNKNAMFYSLGISGNW